MLLMLMKRIRLYITLAVYFLDLSYRKELLISNNSIDLIFAFLCNKALSSKWINFGKCDIKFSLFVVKNIMKNVSNGADKEDYSCYNVKEQKPFPNESSHPFPPSRIFCKNILNILQTCFENGALSGFLDYFCFTFVWSHSPALWQVAWVVL